MSKPIKFRNLDPSIQPKGFLDLLKWKLTSQKTQWPHSVSVEHDHPPLKIEDTQIRISYVGHVTFLIQIQGLNILTDPVWSLRASPFSFLGPKRVTEPGIQMKDLPKIDIILISHNHYDHMDVATIRTLWHRDKPKIITPLMNDKILLSHIPGIEVTTLDWGQKVVVNPDISVYLEAAQHWSARGLFDRNQALWGTFLLKTPIGDICFIGDTGYSSSTFKHIGETYKSILVSLIPIGAFEPRWFMKDVHINPEEAVRIHQELGSQYSIASHFKTFHLADDGFEQAEEELQQAKLQSHISDTNFIIPTVGSAYWFS